MKGNVMGLLRRFRGMATVAMLAIPTFTASSLTTSDAAPAAARPQHVFIIVLENEGYDITFGRNSPAVYLKTLAQQGALLRNYYGIGHFSLDNYIAMVSGQAPNPVTQSDCQDYVDFVQTGTASDGQAIGQGCIYPSGVSTLLNQLQARQLTWKGYMEDMGNDPSREHATCGQPVKINPDGTQQAQQGDQYAARHNPFVYFHAIVDDAPGCAAHVVNLAALAADLKDIGTTPNYAFITPSLCNDGHDQPCVGHRSDGQPSGLAAADRFLKQYVPMILASPAFKQDGLLIVTFDEADIDIADDAKEKFKGDASACCREQPGPNITPGATVFGHPDHGPGIVGPGGGRIGAVLVSPFIKPGTVSSTPYNHYALLRSIEDFFAVAYLGYAGQRGLKSFGRDIFNKR
jgi:hypothetical protein